VISKPDRQLHVLAVYELAASNGRINGLSRTLKVSAVAQYDTLPRNFTVALRKTTKKTVNIASSLSKAVAIF